MRQNNSLSYKILLIIGVFAVIGFILLISLNPALIQTLNDHPEYLYTSVGIGTSMEPYIETGDILIVQRNSSPSFSIHVGDIVCFIDNTGKPIAHRIVGMRYDMYLVKGDNVEKPDGYIKYEDIIGKIVNVVPDENLIARAYVEGIL